MIARAITEKLLAMAEKFPVVTLTGPRQSGKSTLVKAVFPDYAYVSLEDPDERAFAKDDPRSFLERYGTRTVIDEVQRVPTLFSYVQGVVDAENEPGLYVLSGSQNFLLMEHLTQSLAGRVAVLHLLPFSYAEAQHAEKALDWEFVFKGGYPRIYDFEIQPDDYYPNYVRTYLERDVRKELGVGKLEDFERFMSLCALRVGSLVNLDDLARDCGINVKTARSWLSVLQQSFVVYLLPSYYANMGKRLMKSPKLFFCDTGLAASLLGVESPADAEFGSHRGALFENAVLSEVLKGYFNHGKSPKVFFWRDSNGTEVDFLIERGGRAYALGEAKVSATYAPKYFDNLEKVGSLLEVPEDSRYVIYGGSEVLETRHGHVLSLREAHRLAV